MSGHSGMGQPVFLHQGRILMSLPGMEKLADQVGVLLEREHGNKMTRMEAGVEVFANGETKVLIPDTVRNQHVFLMAPMQYPSPNDACMNLFIALDALNRASVLVTTPILPYLSYLRQDRKAKKREPITAKMVIRMIESFRTVNHVIVEDMHSQQAQGFGEIPIDDIPTLGVHVEALRERFKNDFSNVTLVGPDLSSMKRARKVANALDPRIPVAGIDKRHADGDNTKTEVLTLVGDVKGRDCIICDDMIDGGGTTLNAADALMAAGARSVEAITTHALLSGKAIQRFRDRGMQVYATQSIPRSAEFRQENATWLHYEDRYFQYLLADAIHESSIVGGSITKLATD